MNNYGFLNDQDYDPTDDSSLLAVIGDSYVAAAQVDNAKTMHGIMSNEIQGRGRVYSFGSSGSPLSNYLTYAKYATEEFKAEGLVFIIVGNDFDESLAKYKNTPPGYYFSETTNGLELVREDYEPSLIKRISRKSALVRYLVLNIQVNQWSLSGIFGGDGSGNADNDYVGNTLSGFDAARLADSKRAVDAFLNELPMLTGIASEKTLFVMDGMRPHLYDPSLLAQAEGSYFALMRGYFSGVAETLGYEVVDMQPIFIAKYEVDGLRFEFPTDAHWNELGHSTVAEQITDSSVYKEIFGE